MPDTDPLDPAGGDPRLRARAKELFLEIVELPEGERDRRLATAAADLTLRREVEALLAGLAAADQCLVPPRDAELSVGQRLDHYQLLSPLGSGGFGTVWAAQQLAPVQRAVAVKVLKGGMDTREVVARFEAERQALAVMDHASVAKVFDAGITPDGRPYFVMELVEGRPITEHCDAAKLAVRERLALFANVCHAVQHAHHKGVIHRDLKPSNVLVAVQEGSAVPKIIDFGIAKATSAEAGFHGVTTAGPVLLGTPEYMAPEQADPSHIDVDARADVYSLGVLLYELLTGTRPFAMGAGLGGMVEVLRRIREDEPPKPSTRVATAGDGLAPAGRRATTSRQLAATLRQGLDWVVMKALAKDRDRRYQTPQELAEDIGRFLRYEPLLAGPPSGWYRLRTGLRRHRVLVSAALLGTASLAAGAVLATSGYLTAKDRERDALSAQAAAIAAQQAEEVQRERAAAQARKALAVVQVLRRLLGSSDPHEARGPDFTVRALLDEFDREKLGQGLGEEPEVEAAVRATIGRAWTGLGLPEKAEPHLRRALDLRHAHCGAHSTEVAESSLDWVEHLHAVGSYAEALSSVEEVLARPELGTAAPQARAQALILRADLLHHLGRLLQAEQVAREAIAELEARHGAAHASVASVRNVLALVLLARGDGAQAAVLLRELLRLQVELRGKEHVSVATTLHNLAQALYGSLKLEEAARMARSAVAMRRRLLPPRHPEIAATQIALGKILQHQGRLDEAEQQIREALNVLRASFAGQDHDRVVAALRALGDVQDARRDFDAALASYRQALDMAERLHGREHHEVAILRHELGDVLMGQGQLAAAEVEYRAALERLRAALGPDNRRVAITLTGLGFVIAKQGRFAEAEPLCRDALAMHRRQVPPEHPDIALNLINVAHVLRELGKLEEAQAHYEEAIERERQALGPQHLEVASPLTGLGELLERRGDLAGAVAAHEGALAILLAHRGEDDPQLAAGRRRVGRLLLRLGRPKDAQPLFAARAAHDRKTHGEHSAALAESLLDLGLSLLRQDLPHEAVSPLRECLAIRSAMTGVPALYEAQALLGRALFRTGDVEAAEPLILEGASGLLDGRGPEGLREQAIGWAAELCEAKAQPEAARQWRDRLSRR